MEEEDLVEKRVNHMHRLINKAKRELRQLENLLFNVETPYAPCQVEEGSNQSPIKTNSNGYTVDDLKGDMKSMREKTKEIEKNVKVIAKICKVIDRDCNRDHLDTANSS